MNEQGNTQEFLPSLVLVCRVSHRLIWPVQNWQFLPWVACRHFERSWDSSVVCFSSSTPSYTTTTHHLPPTHPHTSLIKTEQFLVIKAEGYRDKISLSLYLIALWEGRERERGRNASSTEECVTFLSSQSSQPNSSPWVTWLRWQPGDVQPVWGDKNKLRVKPPTSFPPSIPDWGMLDGDRQCMSHQPYLSSSERLLTNGVERENVKTQGSW